MNITIVRQNWDPSDVARTILNCARFWSEKGHSVTLVHTRPLGRERDRLSLNCLFEPGLDPLCIPDGDILFCCDWRLAEKCALLPRTKGIKFLLTDRMNTGEATRIIESWRLPMEKVSVDTEAGELVTRLTGGSCRVMNTCLTAKEKAGELEGFFDMATKGESFLFLLSQKDENSPKTLAQYAEAAAALLENGEIVLAQELFTSIASFIEKAAQALEDDNIKTFFGKAYGLAQAGLNRIEEKNPFAEPRGLRASVLYNPVEETMLDHSENQGQETRGFHISEQKTDFGLRIYLDLAETKGGIDHAKWAEAINREDKSAVLCGYYPMNFPGIIELINAIDSKIALAVESSLATDAGSMIPSIQREVLFTVTWTPGRTLDPISLGNIKAIKENPNTALVVGLSVDADEEAFDQERERFLEYGITLRPYFPPACIMPRGKGPLQKAWCRRTGYVVAPDGTRYPCHSKMIRSVDPMENMLAGELGLNAHLSLCPEFGLCAPCDLEGNIFKSPWLNRIFTGRQNVITKKPALGQTPEDRSIYQINNLKHLLINNSPHMLAVQGCMYASRIAQYVYYLKLLQGLGILEEGQNRALHDQVVQVHLDQLVHMYLVDELQILGLFGLFGIGIEKPPFVLEIQEGLGADVLGQQKSARVRAVGRDGADLRRVFEEPVGRDAGGDGQIPKLAIHGQLLQMVAVADLHSAVLGKKNGQHLRVLPGDLVPQLGQNACGHPQVHPDIIDVPCPGSATGHEQKLMLFFGFDQFVQDGQKRLGPPVHYGLAPYLEYVHVRLHVEILFRLGRLEQVLADQGFSQKSGLYVQTAFFAFFLYQLTH